MPSTLVNDVEGRQNCGPHPLNRYWIGISPKDDYLPLTGMVCTVGIGLDLQEVNLSNPELHRKRENIFPFLKVPSWSTAERNIAWRVSFDVFLDAVERKPRTVLVLIEVWLLTGDCSKVNMIQVGGTMTLANVMRRALPIMYFKSQLGCWCLGSDFKSLQHHYLQVWLWCLDTSESWGYFQQMSVVSVSIPEHR